MEPQTNVSPIINQAPPPAAPVPTASPTPAAPTIKYAGFWVRFVAYFIDGIILFIPGFILSFISGVIIETIGLKSLEILFSIIISFAIPMLYYCLLTYYKGATYGKMFMGLEVRSVDNQKLPVGKIVIRETIGKIISSIILCIGYIMIAFTEKKQGLHDLMAGSVVVYKDPTKKLSVWKKVVIAIVFLSIIILPILLFSSVVLLSLNTARVKSDDAKTRSALTSMRSNMEFYLSQNNNSYSTADDCDSGAFANETIKSYIGHIPKEKIICKAMDTSYAVSALLNDEKYESFCVDSSGYTGKGSVAVDETRVMCEKPSI